MDFSLEEFDVEQFRLALTIELEHGSCHPETDVTHDDPMQTGRLALAHLHGRPDFYEYLRKVEGELPD